MCGHSASGVPLRSYTNSRSILFSAAHASGYGWIASSCSAVNGTAPRGSGKVGAAMGSESITDVSKIEIAHRAHRGRPRVRRAPSHAGGHVFSTAHCDDDHEPVPVVMG